MTNLIPTDLFVKLNCVNSENVEKNLFIFAGIEGNCDVFKELAESLADSSIQVYGLQFTQIVPLTSITSIAIFYLHEIKTLLCSQHGPASKQEIYLAAYSYSGAISIELSRILEEDYLTTIKLKKLFLFDTSHCFFKIGAHLNFKIFNHDILKDSFLNHKHVYTAVLSIYMTSLFGLSKYKFDLYENLQNSLSLDDGIDRAFEFFKKNNLINFEDEQNLNENKEYLKLLLLKSDPCLLYEYPEKQKLRTPIYLFKPKLFMYSKSLASYFQMKNAIKFNNYDYNLSDIAETVRVCEFPEGSHWSFIDENLNEISSTINNEINNRNIISKL